MNNHMEFNGVTLHSIIIEKALNNNKSKAYRIPVFDFALKNMLILPWCMIMHAYVLTPLLCGRANSLQRSSQACYMTTNASSHPSSWRARLVTSCPRDLSYQLVTSWSQVNWTNLDITLKCLNWEHCFVQCVNWEPCVVNQFFSNQFTTPTLKCLYCGSHLAHRRRCDQFDRSI